MNNKDTLKLLISEELKGIIWKIVLDDSRLLMVIETRTPDRETFFYVYDFASERFLWRHEKLKSELSLVLHSCFDGKVYFQSMQAGPVPEHTFILAYDAYTKALLFEKYTHNLEAVSEIGLVSFPGKILPKKLELLDLSNGNFVRSLSFSELSELPFPANDIHLPDDHFGPTLWETYQQLRFKNYTVKAFYRPGTKDQDQVLELYDEKQLVLTDYLNQTIQKLYQDTFFVWSGRLIYIRNKREIVSYLL